LLPGTGPSRPKSELPGPYCGACCCGALCGHCCDGYWGYCGICCGGALCGHCCCGYWGCCCGICCGGRLYTRPSRDSTWRICGKITGGGAAGGGAAGGGSTGGGAAGTSVGAGGGAAGGGGGAAGASAWGRSAASWVSTVRGAACCGASCGARCGASCTTGTGFGMVSGGGCGAAGAGLIGCASCTGGGAGAAVLGRLAFRPRLALRSAVGWALTAIDMTRATTLITKIAATRLPTGVDDSRPSQASFVFGPLEVSSVCARATGACCVSASPLTEAAVTAVSPSG